MQVKDIKILWGRSGNRCAICKIEITPDGEIDTIGEISHIVSRSPEGLSIVAIIEPVFFAVMKPAQRAQKQSWTPLSKHHFHLLFGVNILLFLRQ
jgi:hypothetical protein